MLHARSLCSRVGSVRDQRQWQRRTRPWKPKQKVETHGRPKSPCWSRCLEGQTYLAAAKAAPGKEYAVEDGYFVLGDNTMDSDDSRFEGAIPGRRIVGRARAIIWPLGRIRLL